MTAAAENARSPLSPAMSPPPVPPTSFPLTDQRRTVLVDDPCEAGSPGAAAEHAGIYLHARYFDPQLGVFLSPDPIGVRGGGLNLFGYAGGDPINRSDRSGLSWQEHCTERTRTREANSSVEVEIITECKWVWIPDPVDERTRDPRQPRDPRDPDPKDPKDPKDPDPTDPPDEGNGQSQTPPSCQAGITPTGIVIAGGADGAIGLAAGAMAQGSFGVAFAQGMTLFGSGGVHAGLPATAGFTRPQPGGDRNAFRGFALGASAGIDFQVGVTNITRPSDLDGPFMTVNLGTPFGSGQFAFGTGDRGFIYTATGGTPSAGLSFSVYRTTTATLNVVNRAGACK